MLLNMKHIFSFVTDLISSELIDGRYRIFVRTLMNPTCFRAFFRMAGMTPDVLIRPSFLALK